MSNSKKVIANSIKNLIANLNTAISEAEKQNLIIEIDVPFKGAVSLSDEKPVITAKIFEETIY